MGEMPVKGLLPCLRQALDTAAAVTDQATDIAAAKTHEGSRHAAWFPAPQGVHALPQRSRVHRGPSMLCAGGTKTVVEQGVQGCHSVPKIDAIS